MASSLALPVIPPWGSIDDYPVVNVSWTDVVGSPFLSLNGFCSWASDTAGIRLTLPSESQLEYATRGGNLSNEFPWGEKFDDRKLWCSYKEHRNQPAPVLRSKNTYLNKHGLTDLVGNVWQLCYDLYLPYRPDRIGGASEVSKSPDGTVCIRGGSWKFSYPTTFRCSSRNRMSSTERSTDVGFRLCASAQT